MPLEPLVIERKRICTTSWWIEASRKDFTQYAAQMTNTIVPCDDVSDAEVETLADLKARMRMVLEAA